MTDGDGGTSNQPTKTINVVAKNDAPVITNFDVPTPITYTENQAAITIDADATIADVDSANFDTGKLTLQLTSGAESTDRLEIRNVGTAAGQIGVTGTDVTYGGVVIGTFAGGTGTTPLVVTFNLNATLIRVTALLRNMTFRSTSENPSTTPRVVKVTLTDGDGGTSNQPSKTIRVVAVNEAPIIANFESPSPISYTENGTPVLLDIDSLVADIDSVNFDTGTLSIQLISGSEASDTLAIRNVGIGSGQIGINGADVTYGGIIVGSFTGGVGATPLVVTLNANATPTITSHLLRNITFHSTSDNPSTVSRVVRVTLTDGDGGTSNKPTKTINIIAVNDPPSVNGFDGSISYAVGGPSVAIDDDATISDADSANFDGGTLTVAITANVESSDILEIQNQGVGVGQIGVSGSNITFGGIVIGTFTGGNGATPLVVTLNANATPAATQALLRNITFRNTSATPSTNPRTAKVTLTDGDGGTSNIPTKQINVTV
ncbi:MAG: hypothetical protein FJ267_09665 [Planctomycetes bacterium]|nr:hypothetical protein [Planctomycetota bacterium]